MNDQASAPGLRRRLDAAYERIKSTPSTGPGVYGAPDPKTGERWNAGNVLGHVAEMLPFWVDQMNGVLAGKSEIGRGEEGYARRKEGIEAGTVLSEADLRKRLDAGVAAARELLDGMPSEVLERRITYRSLAGDREDAVAAVLDDLIVSHLEAHASQLAELG
jgi:hypothetical protein